MNYVKLFLAGTLFYGLLVITVFAQNSVLHEGNWYKLSTSENGIYKIGYTDLQSFGIDPAAVNPKTIRLFGNGDGMLPENPDLFRYDDLYENAIFVYGEEDESFDPGDYVLFYGEDPVVWKFTEWNLKEKVVYFEHETNIYTDEVCYFLNYGMADGKRIEDQNSTTELANYTCTAYNEYFTHDLDLVSLLGSGKVWYGESFDENEQYLYNLDLPGMVPTELVYIALKGGARSSETSKINGLVDGQTAFNLVIPATSYTSTTYARDNKVFSGIYTTSPQIDLTLVGEKPNDSSLIWLDYFTINYRRSLSFWDESLIFRDLTSADEDYVTEFKIDSPDDNIQIWNITHPLDPQNVIFQYADGVASYTLETDSLLEFIAFNNSQYLSPEFKEIVPNQNLHAANPVDLLIIAPQEFENQAQQLATYRQNNDGLSTMVVTPGLIYNEFSSGVQDVTAIRDFTKHMFEKDTADGLKYLLLFGKASYDYKDRLDNNTNFVPVWESDESLNTVHSYCSDDFYGLFKGQSWATVQLAIGRIPTVNVTQANAMVQKLTDYNNNSVSAGSWRNEITFVADDEDNNIFIIQSDSLANTVGLVNSAMNINKIYLDAFVQQVNNSGLPVYPDVNLEITDQINQGNLLMIYTGHGGNQQLAMESILSPDDFDNWHNDTYFPFMINASGGVNGFDNPNIVSLGENLLLLPDKGMMSVLSPSRASYSLSNFRIALGTLNAFVSDKNKSTGEIIKEVKQAYSNNILGRYILFGDPSMKLAFPQLNIETETINGIPATMFSDTLNPGMQINLAGNITDDNGSPVLNFDGEITLKVFDRPEVKSTLGNDPSSPITEFMTQETVIAQIVTDVISGEFDATFTLPQTLDAEFGPIKISYYASSDETDAQGQYSEIIVGGPYNAVEGQSACNSVKVYPTLVQDKINIEVMEDISHLHLELLDLSGKTIQLQEKSQIRSGERLTMNVSGFKKGLYILRLSLGEGTIQYKIVKK